MNAIPAKAAGVARLAMVAPVPGGEFNPAVAYAAVRAGVTEFYPIGGAQAVAALAYGAGQSQAGRQDRRPRQRLRRRRQAHRLRRCRHRHHRRPLRDHRRRRREEQPDWIAADLLSQAEHDPMAQSILITDDAAFAQRVFDAAEAHAVEALATRDRSAGATTPPPSSRRSPQAAAIVNQIAPEHVEIATADPDAIAKDVRHSGAIFLGRWAPEALGDYVTGSNHVLPTSGAARFASGLQRPRLHEAHLGPAHLGARLQRARPRRRNARRQPRACRRTRLSVSIRRGG